MATNISGCVQLQNPYKEHCENDFLYHLGFLASDAKIFSDVKIVLMGGSPNRMKTLAEKVRQTLNMDVGKDMVDLTESANRYAMYKIGPVICVSHGMGMPSISILLHELIKLLHYAKCQNPVFIRIGTSGGIGVEPGTVIVTSKPLNGYLRNQHDFVILGECVSRPAFFDENLSRELIECAEEGDNYEIISGNTMACDDFYEGQGRIDGAICKHTESGKMEFLKKCYEKGVRNIEMEATVLAALTHEVGIPAADICVTFLDRLRGDQVTSPKKHEFEDRPLDIVCRFIRKKLMQ